VSGQFIGVRPPAGPGHSCIFPQKWTLPNWTVWRCDCGKAYRLEAYDPGHDVQTGDDAYSRWTRFPTEDV
jgi:hypothetical protein